MSAVPLNGPVLDSIPTPSGKGYYMVASDGGIFTFGDAEFLGSMGAVKLNAPVQSSGPDPDGKAYWLVASDGGIFAFEASFQGSMGGVKLNKPVTGMVAFGIGYLMVAEDGGIFNFSDKDFLGSLGDNPPANPIVSVSLGAPAAGGASRSARPGTEGARGQSSPHEVIRTPDTYPGMRCHGLMTLITSEETAVIPVIPVNTHPAVPLLWRAHDLVAADPALLPLRHRLAIVATDPSGWEETLRRITRTLRRAGHDEAADHIGHALLLLAVLPSPVATAA